jgi:energy-coupling factor transport system permease protein
MSIFLYSDQDSLVHRLDPRTKLASMLFLFTLALLFNHPLFSAGVGLLLGLGLTAAKVWPRWWRFRWLLALLFISSCTIWSLTLKGFPVWLSAGPLQISREALGYGLAMGIRLVTFVSTGILFLSVTRNEEITQGLIRLKVPYPMAFAFSTALRLVPTFVGVGATIIQAQRSRGLDLDSGNIFRRVGQFIPQAVPLLIYALRYTNFLAMALECRGFDPGYPRTWYRELKLGPKDYGVLTGGLFLIGLAVFIRFGLSGGVVIPQRL